MERLHVLTIRQGAGYFRLPEPVGRIQRLFLAPPQLFLV